MCPHDPTHPHEPSDQSGALVTARPGPVARFGMWLIRGYQRYLSPLKPPVCRFQPSCSEYTRLAIERYGLLRGSWLGARRIARCQPMFPGGYDPVP